MHINFCNVIVIKTICLIYSIGFTWANDDCDTNQAGTNCPLKEDGIADVLSKTSDLFIPHSSFDNNEQAIDILKSALSSNDDNEKDGLKYGRRKENVFENARNIFDDQVVAEPSDLSKPKSIEKFDQVPRFDNTPTHIERKSINSIKSPESSFTALSSVYENKTSKNNSTAVKAENPTSSTEISLSEITKLSLDNDKGTSLGQKVEFQQSSKDLEMSNDNPVGKEILKNITRVCGYLLGKRISFAEPTTLMEFPWTALLLYNTNIRYHCGGSLITTKYVLTAAHCVAQEFYELTGVRLGEHDISEPVDCAPDVGGSKICAATVDADVVKIIVHHDYSHLSFKNDIALLRLDNEYFGRSYYPICLPTPDMMYASNTATVAGWGATEKAIRSSVLLKATVPIFDISKCREIYRYNAFNDTTEICASGANEIDVCKGDSGGAIFYSDTVRGKDVYIQLGIISLGVRGCGDKRFLPAVFTKLNAFYKWIENNLEY